ncbi:hypothetical protein H4219_002078 [Mycoemilia scoparia]|uniref:Cytochrome c oxidase assembly protein COX20, mitochondrial n=1 Tax=Mycoemilia scoparia TaxID=417184 RepID=A0A9W8A253_9FUNG|nr:hypothetical protein H4219_002078 [Mycoemilia scoparia]
MAIEDTNVNSDQAKNTQGVPNTTQTPTDPPSSSTSSEQQNKQRPTFSESFRNQSIDGFKNVAKLPCAREGLMYGIGTGFVAGVLRFIQKGNVMSAGNWAVGTFVAVAIIGKEACHFQRRHQHAKIATALKNASVKSTMKVEKVGDEAPGNATAPKRNSDNPSNDTTSTQL